ncbi:uracil-DNA glycosylase [uncultured Shewanella sp.]|uniref:uracil-DNA glycosylase n=1 Tax=uncultured Shewanella sp. TaxID=173975 RepID=UPI00262DF512|nr:uracil-DNA glycosylase [uncultured Shewanella sp.]
MTKKHTHWQSFLAEQEAQAYYQSITDFVFTERAAGKTIYPPQNEVLNALTLTPLEKVKVVLLGQDPYHGPNQAHGLCFSVKEGIKVPPSLVNIYKELATDIDGFRSPQHGCLTPWAKQGVLMLNTVLTVEQGKAHSHAKVGWETFTDNILRVLNEQTRSIIFVLWGGHAIKKGKLINAKQHVILSGPHPSPLSAYRGFLGCRHFSEVNRHLLALGETAIDWQV